jgi:Phosphotransferase enzyme family
MPLPPHLLVPIQAVTEVVLRQGLVVDRCDVLQDGNTLVLRLSEGLVARVVVDRTGPRQGQAWFARETAIAGHLTQHRAPVIPLHAGLAPGPHEHLGYTMNFWQFVTAVPEAVAPEAMGRTLYECHRVLVGFPEALPVLGILTECDGVIAMVRDRGLFPVEVVSLLQDRLHSARAALRCYPQQALHGDAHVGNAMHTTQGLLWTDWEDAFAGPVEWDLASLIWNAQVLDGDDETVGQMLGGYRQAGGVWDAGALRHSLVARAVVMTAWYPILYPDMSVERRLKLSRRIAWLRGSEAGLLG